MIFEGTHPTLTQVPPSVPDSIKVTVAPPFAASIAAANAPEPLPIITTLRACKPPLPDLDEKRLFTTPATERLASLPLCFAETVSLGSRSSAPYPLARTALTSDAPSTSPSASTVALPSRYDTAERATPLTSASADSTVLAQWSQVIPEICNSVVVMETFSRILNGRKIVVRQ